MRSSGSEDSLPVLEWAQRLGELAQGIAAAGAQTQGGRFLNGFRGSETISFAGKLTSGMRNALVNKNRLKEQFSACFWRTQNRRAGRRFSRVDNGFEALRIDGGRQ